MRKEVLHGYISLQIVIRGDFSIGKNIGGFKAAKLPGRCIEFVKIEEW